MTQEFNYRGYKIEVWIGNTTSRYYIYREGQFLLKGKETAGTNIHSNGLLKAAKLEVESEEVKRVFKKRMSKFGMPWANIK